MNGCKLQLLYFFKWETKCLFWFGYEIGGGKRGVLELDCVSTSHHFIKNYAFNHNVSKWLNMLQRKGFFFFWVKIIIMYILG